MSRPLKTNMARDALARAQQSRSIHIVFVRIVFLRNSRLWRSRSIPAGMEFEGL
jgi:hypothetical protein